MVPYLYILPNMILFLTFMIIPIFMSFYYSTVKWNGLGDPKFIGLENYLYIFTDDVFIKSMFNTVYYSAVTVPILMVLSLLFAALLNNKIPLRGLIRSSIYAPAVVSTVVVGTVFIWIFQDQLGLINYIITLLGGEGINWQNDTRFAMVMIIVATIWQKTGYNMVIYLAGLQGISPELYEAAKLDGANGMQIFWRMTVPLLTPSLFFLSTMNIMNGMRVFDIVYTFIGKADQGGPIVDASRTLVFGIYERAFSFLNMGEASAEAVLLFVMIMIVTVIQFKFQDKWVFYE